MARKAREKSATGIYHILLRAAERLFFDDKDKEYFVSLVKQYLTDGAAVYAIRTERDRVHFIIKEKEKTISQVLKPFCTSYARYFNRVHNSDGKLFDGRFKSEPIEDGAVLAKTIGFLYRDNPEAFKNDKTIAHSELGKIRPEKENPYLAMDAYSAMTDEEIKEFVSYLSGGIDGFDALSDEEKINAVAEADVASRLRSTMIKRALGAEKARTIKPKHTEAKKTIKKTERVKKEKPETEFEKKKSNKGKKELPVWLL